MPMWWKRYEPILEARPKPIADVLTDMLVKEMCEVCEAFPPPAADVDWIDERHRKRFEEALPQLPAVDEALADLLGDLVAKDLEREFEAIDHLFRNERYLEACPTRQHLEAVHFLWPFLVELLFTRKEESTGHIKRRHLVEAAKRFPARFRHRRARNIV